MAYESVKKSLTGTIGLIPAFLVLVDRAKEVNGDNFNVSDIWRNEVEALSKTKFTFMDGNEEFTDSILQYVNDELNNELIVKFSSFLPMDEEQDNKYNYKYEQAAYEAPKRISETIPYGYSEPVKKELIANDCIAIGADQEAFLYGLKKEIDTNSPESKKEIRKWQHEMGIIDDKEWLNFLND